MHSEKSQTPESNTMVVLNRPWLSTVAVPREANAQVKLDTNHSLIEDISDLPKQKPPYMANPKP